MRSPRCSERIAPEADLGTVPADEDLRQALDIDSFDFLNLVIGIKQKLGIEIPESDHGQLSTVDATVLYLKRRSSQGM